MIHKSILLALLPLQAIAAPPLTDTDAVILTAPDTSSPETSVLPQMRFISSIVGDEVLAVLKAHQSLSRLDEELPGSPLVLAVTHTIRPTAGGTAAGLISAILAGGSLGILPVVTNQRMVIRYEVLLNGRTIVRYDFEDTATRAENIWAAGHNEHDGLGDSQVEWVESTAAEVATRLSQDPVLLALGDEIGFYFPAAAAVRSESPTDQS